MPQIVYRYGLHAPHENLEIVYQQLRLAHRYRNILVEIERGRRAAIRALELQAGDMPAAMRALGSAKALEEAAYKAVARHRATTRKRNESPELKANLLSARAAVREASEHVQQIRQAIKASPEVTAERDRIGEMAKSLAKNAYRYSGVYWGQRALVDEEAAASFVSVPMYTKDWRPNDPSFVRWTGDGAVALQIMGGLSPDKVHGGGDSRLRIAKPDPKAWSGARSERRRYGSTAELALRVGSEGRDPIFARWVCDMDRPLPKEASIVWATVHRRMRGPHSEWSLCLTLDLPSGAYARGASAPTIGGAVAVDVGWRKIGDELRVAGWADERGNTGELRLDAATLRALHLPEEIRSERDLRFDAARGSLASVVDRLQGAPVWLKDLTRGIRSWKSPARLAAVCRDWPTESQSAVLDAAYRDLCAWYYRDRHDWEAETAARPRALRRRREIYRIFAARLASSYDTIVVEQFDKRVFAVRPVAAAEDDVAQNETARGNRVVASTSELVMSIVNGCRSRCRTVAAVSAVDTTRACPSCGLVADRGADKSIDLRCECGHTWDQDVTGAAPLLLKRWRELPSDAKLLVGAEEKEEESKWERVARLRKEKEERMTTARKKAGNG